MIKKYGWGVHQARVVYTGAGPAFVTNEGLLIEIEGGEWGAQIRHLHVAPVFLKNLSDAVWMCLVFVGKIGNLAALQIGAADGAVPLYAPSDAKNLLYASPLGVSNLATPVQGLALDVNFRENGPSVEAGETISIAIFPVNPGFAPAAVNSPALITAIVLGGDIIQTSTPTPEAISTDRV